MTSSLGPLAIAPLGPLACGSLLVRVGRELWAVVVAKATFALAHDRAGWLVDPAPLVEADRYRGGDPRKSLVAASDFVPFLPNAGVTITGSARTTGGTPAATATAGFAIFHDAQVLVSKTVHVYGETTRSAPQPMPFVEMPIEYERAFGGSRSTDNPVGVGTDDTTPALPNVMNPSDPRRPTGFGPIPPTWEPRRGRLWSAPIGREGNVVTFSDAFPWDALHAAPTDQRTEYLQGDEWIVLHGFDARFARLQTRLPSARAEARFQRADRPGHLTPIALVADTLAIDADRLIATVIWRGHLVVASPEEAGALGIYVGIEMPNMPIPWPAQQAQESPHERPPILDETTALPAFTSPNTTLPFEEVHDTDPRTAPASRPSTDLGPKRSALSGTAEVDTRMIRMALPFAGGGTPKPAAVAPPALVPVQNPEPAGHGEWGAAASPAAAYPAYVPPDASPVDDETTVSAAPEPESSDVRVAAAARAKKGRPLAGLELAGADLSGLDLTEADLHGMNLERTNLAKTNLSRGKLAHAKLGGADLSGAKLDGADLEGADLSRATLDDATFEAANLSGARLNHARAAKTRFVSAAAKGASFSRVVLDGAVFVDAKLDGADFTGASLVGTGFTNASLADVRLVDARAKGAVFDGAQLPRANLGGASLAGASFRLAVAPNSTWDAATLDGAAFEAADLHEASLYRVSAVGVMASDVDLRGANVQRIAAAGGTFSRARFAKADLRQATFKGAQLDEAHLRGAQAGLANFEGANLARADLSEGAFREANFTEADLSSARLDRADLRDANLERANIHGATRQGTNSAGAKTAGIVETAAKPGR